MAELKIPYLQGVTPARLFTLLTLIVLLVILITKFFVLKEHMALIPPSVLP